MDTSEVMHICRDITADYVSALPIFTRNLRDAAIVSWVLAWDCMSYSTIPYFWQRCVSTVLLGCRLVRIGAPQCKTRGYAIDSFCAEFIEALWKKRTRRYIGLWSAGYRVTNTKLTFELAYDTMWTLIEEMK